MSSAQPLTGPIEPPPASPAALDRRIYFRPIAHRGLHNLAAGRIENTDPAFAAAIERGYGIECDLQSAADGTPMVFHDETLDRLTDGRGPIAACLPKDLSSVRYKGQDTPILTFAELLELVAGRAPLLVEVKHGARPSPAHFLERIAEAALAYRGPIALMSFDPGIVAMLARHAPTVPLGLVVGSNQLAADPAASQDPEVRITAVGDLLGTAPRGIAFFAVDVEMLEAAHAWRARQHVDVPLFVWTVRTPADRARAARWADAPIFECYEP